MIQLLISMAALFSVCAQANSDVILNGKTYLLSADQAGERRLLIHYPGQGAERSKGVCAIDLITSSPLSAPASRLAKRLRFQGAFGGGVKEVQVLSKNLLRVPLRAGTYVDGVRIASIRGASLSVAIREALGSGATVIAQPMHCDFPRR